MALHRQWEKAEQTVLSLDALGYASVKPEQLEAIKSLLRGEDVFVSAPYWIWKESYIPNTASVRSKSSVVVWIFPDRHGPSRSSSVSIGCTDARSGIKAAKNSQCQRRLFVRSIKSGCRGRYNTQHTYLPAQRQC